jgi:flavodoxin
VLLIGENNNIRLKLIKRYFMENKIIIIYQSGKHGNTKGIAENIAKELGCTAIDVKTDPIVNLEQYNVVGFGSGIYAGSFGRTLKK